MPWSRSSSIWFRRTRTSPSLRIMASYSARKATSGTGPSSTQRSSRCRSSKVRSDEAAGPFSGSLCRGPDTHNLPNAPAGRSATRLYRSRRWLRVPWFISHADHVSGAEYRFAAGVAVSHGLAAGQPPPGISQGAHQEAHLSWPRWFRSWPGRAFHVRRQTAEPEPSERTGLLLETTHDLSSAVSGCVVDVRHRRESREA